MTPPSILPIITALALQIPPPSNNQSLSFYTCENNITNSHLSELQNLKKYYQNEHIDFFPLFSNYTEKSQFHLFDQTQFAILSTFYFHLIKTHPYFEKSTLSKIILYPFYSFFSTPIPKNETLASLIPFICEIEYCIQDSFNASKPL